MTDSSSNKADRMDEASAEMAEMAAELIHAKMESAKADGHMTHVLRIGTFHMELVPDSDINVEDIFNTMIDTPTIYVAIVIVGFILLFCTYLK